MDIKVTNRQIIILMMKIKTRIKPLTESHKSIQNSLITCKSINSCIEVLILFRIWFFFVRPSHLLTTKKPFINLIKSNLTTCTNPAINEFPSDVFSQKSRSRGAIIIHVLVVLYMFYCLAVVCDLYFLPSLEECCQVLPFTSISLN